MISESLVDTETKLKLFQELYLRILSSNSTLYCTQISNLKLQPGEIAQIEAHDILITENIF